jgi:hypothetical protein
MDWYVHDSSLNGQYATAEDFLAVFSRLLKLRTELPAVRERLRCSRTIGLRPATQTQTLRQVVQSTSDRNLRNLILQWLESRGPFWEDDSADVQENYFECNGVDVTNEGSGEAARRLLLGFEAATVSFPQGRFDYSPIEVMQGIPEERVANIQIPNCWEADQLRASALDAAPAIGNWEQSLDYARTRFTALHFADNLLDFLRRETFTIHLAESIFARLFKLQEFVESRNTDGTNSEETDRLIAAHFAGAKAWFTDESESNKGKFRGKLTFADPLAPEVELFCPFHGKVKTPQYRIHFPWPMESRERVLRIVYIGPKITKD